MERASEPMQWRVQVRRGADEGHVLGDGPFVAALRLAAVGVRREELVRRVDLDHADAEVEDAADLVADVHLVQRIHRADRHEAIAMILRVVRDPVVHLAGEAHDVR